jgi:hypothetical protein
MLFPDYPETAFFLFTFPPLAAENDIKPTAAEVYVKIALFHTRNNHAIAVQIGEMITGHSCDVIYRETEKTAENDFSRKALDIFELATHILFIDAQAFSDFPYFLFLSGLCLGRGVPLLILETGNENPLPAVYRCLGKILTPTTFEEFFVTEQKRFIAEDKMSGARKELLKRGISCFDENFMFIVSSGDAEAVSLFLDAGFDPSLVDAKGIPLLSLAVRAQFPRVASLLIDAGADINRLSGDRGYSPLMDAVQKGDIAMVKLLLEKGSLIDLRSKDGQTALILCAGRGDIDMAEILVSYGADFTLKDNLGMSALGYAQLFKNLKLMELFNIPSP